MKVITLLNQKGGTGKTTTCLNLGAALSFCGLKCLLVEMDPQSSLSISCGFNALTDDDITTYEVLTGADINDAVKTKQAKKSYDVLPTDIRLSAGEIELVETKRRNFLLRDALQRLKKKYDVVLIDSPPTLNIFSMMTLTAADEVIIPVQAQYLALTGVAQIRDTLKIVKERFNNKLEIGGVLVTYYDNRRNLDREVADALAEAFPGKVFKTKISNNTKVAEAPSYGQDILEYSPSSKGAEQYKALAKEVRKRL